jgi:hypothetical protein
MELRKHSEHVLGHLLNPLGDSADWCVKASGDNAFRSDWLAERRGLEPSVSREVLPKEKRAQMLVIFRVELHWNPRENEFAVSSVRYPTLAFNSGVARMRLG